MNEEYQTFLDFFELTNKLLGHKRHLNNSKELYCTRCYMGKYSQQKEECAADYQHMALDVLEEESPNKAQRINDLQNVLKGWIK